jgi:uncharacterized protein YjiS (DUF1127 family)
MSVSSVNTPVSTALFSRITNVFWAAVDGISKHYKYKSTLNQLSALSAHELADLGLHRSSLRDTAYRAVYQPW